MGKKMKTGLAVFMTCACLCSYAIAQELCPLPPSVSVGEHPKGDVPFDIEALKSTWRNRISAVKASGSMPVIDIESSFNSGKLNARDFARDMDQNGVALVAFSPEISEGEYKKNKTLWSDASRRALNVDPCRYIPVTTAGIHPAWTDNPDEFLTATIQKAGEDRYPLLGEFEFRHYMSPRQYERGQTYRDITIPVNSPVGVRLFAYAATSGIPFEIHYEVEDALLPPLEEMLSRYPKAKVIWCHMGQVRYAARAKKYGPDYVRKLIETYPNLYFDLAFGDGNSRYKPSDEYHARVWDPPTGKVKKEWVALISDHPWRFLAALDLGGDRMDNLAKNSRVLRKFIGDLPPHVQEIVAYKAAWKLLFNEEI